MNSPSKLDPVDACSALQHCPDYAEQDNLSDAHDLLALVRPCFRRLPPLRGTEGGEAEPAALTVRLDRFAVEAGMRDGKLKPQDLVGPRLHLLRTYAGSILCVCLGHLLSRAGSEGTSRPIAAPIKDWMHLFVEACAEEPASEFSVLDTFSPSQRFLISMSLRLTARMGVENGADRAMLEQAASSWFPRE